MSKNRVFHLLSLFIGQSNVLTVSVALIDLTGDHTSALFLSQCAYWASRTDNPDGWFFKTHEQWFKELRFTPDMVRRAAAVCAPFGVEMARRGAGGKNHFRVNEETLIAALESKFACNGETQLHVMGKPNNRCWETQLQMLGNPITAPYIAEPTAETTTKNNNVLDTENAENTLSLSRENQEPLEISANSKPSSKGAAGRDEIHKAMFAAYNENRGGLPGHRVLSPAFKKGFDRVIKTLTENGLPESEAIAEITAATMEAAISDYWIENRYNLENLLRHVHTKADQWRSREKARKQDSKPANGPKTAADDWM